VRAPRHTEETALFKGLDAQRLVAVFFAGWALLNFPLLTLWPADARLWGLPLLPTMLFGVWAALIALVAWIVERDDEGDGA
jgi:fatty acid desaturase